MHPGSFTWARNRGFIGITIPRELGGLGLPPRNNRERGVKCLSHYWRVGLYGFVAHGSGFYEPRKDTSRPWVVTPPDSLRLEVEANIMQAWTVPTVEGLLDLSKVGSETVKFRTRR